MKNGVGALQCPKEEGPVICPKPVRYLLSRLRNRDEAQCNLQDCCVELTLDFYRNF